MTFERTQGPADVRDDCADFAAPGDDMVVGTIGSEPGISTVLLRTDAGMEGWVKAAGAFEDAPIGDLGAVKRLALKNVDRAAASPPPSRSHHYTVAC